MGLFDNLKNVLGGKKQDNVTAATTSPSQVLRENGLDPSGLNFAFGSEGNVTVNGTIAQETDRQKIAELLENIPGISNVIDNMSLPTADVADGSVVEEEAEAADSANIYTVQSGDTLWKIAHDAYGDGSKYMQIFEANKDVLESPDRNVPGQKLVIPEIKD
jgi:nucleoid-associated protein YgaU